MVKPYNIYLGDFSYRFLYVSISYLCCWIIFFLNINTVFLFEIIPLFSIIKAERLIITQITQIFNTVIFSSLYMSALFIFPLVIYHFKSFWKSSWYVYQKKLYINLIIFTFVIFSFVYFCLQFLFIPNLINFYLFWDFSSTNSVFKIEAEISLFYYIVWSLIIKYELSLILVLFFFSLYLFRTFLSITNLYRLIKKFKLLSCFIFICMIFLLIPPDFVIQIIVSIGTYIYFECFFFLSCIIIYVKINK